MTAARSLVTTMKLADQYKALLPAILLGLKPALTQDRPEIERDYETMMPMITEAFTPYYTSMVDGIATVYATNFTAAESQIRDANVSADASDLARLSVLQQAGVAALAQANQSSSAVLKLLG